MNENVLCMDEKHTRVFVGTCSPLGRLVKPCPYFSTFYLYFHKSFKREDAECVMMCGHHSHVFLPPLFLGFRVW